MAFRTSRHPKERPVVVLCKSGIRAEMAVIALRQLDFERVCALRGGFKALSDYLDPVRA